MAYNYLMKYVGKYRVLPELDQILHDVPRKKMVVLQMVTMIYTYLARAERRFITME